MEILLEVNYMILQKSKRNYQLSFYFIFSLFLLYLTRLLSCQLFFFFFFNHVPLVIMIIMKSSEPAPCISHLPLGYNDTFRFSFSNFQIIFGGIKNGFFFFFFFNFFFFAKIFHHGARD